MATTRILVLRHGEKTGDPDDIHLSAAGAARAQALADYIPATFGVPQFLFATAQSKHSRRPIETLAPLSARLGSGVPFNADFPDKGYDALANLLLTDTRYLGALIVICWHHGKIPELLAALGAHKGSYVAPWPENVFNLTYELTYANGVVPDVRALTQPF